MPLSLQPERPSGWEDGRTKKGACRVTDSLSERAEAMRPSPSSRVWVLDLEVQAVVPTSGLFENAKDGLH
jgi:hypothetical protein